MSHLSQHKLPEETEKELKSALKDTMLRLSSSEFDKTFSALVTETEELMIAKRLGIVLMLSEGASYYQISQSLKVTNETIARINSEINTHPLDYKYVTHKLKPWKRKQFITKLLGAIGAKVLTEVAKNVGRTF